MKKMVSLLFVLFLFSFGCSSADRSDETTETKLEIRSASDYGIELGLPFSVETPHKITRAYCPVMDESNDSCVSHQQWASYDDRYAIDFAGGSGLDVLAAHDGTVTVAGDGGGWGNHVLIKDTSGVITSHYGHLSRILVSVGQRVSRGETIGLEGNTGNSTGPHIHFAVYDNATKVAVKPEPLSGYSGFDTALHNPNTGHFPWVGRHRFAHFPVGTLIKGIGKPEIYLVCSDTKICHVKDWESFKANKFWHNVSNPNGLLIEVTDDVVGCYEKGPDIETKSGIELIVCDSKRFLVQRVDGQLLRRLVPDSQDRSHVLRSWGFEGIEPRIGTIAECPVWPTSDGPILDYRPGTVIMEPTDNDFWVVTTDDLTGGDRSRFYSGVSLKRLRREEKISAKDYEQLAFGIYRGFNQVIPTPGCPSSRISGQKCGSVQVPEINLLSSSYCPRQTSNLPDWNGGGDSGSGDDDSDNEPSTGGQCAEGERRCDDSRTYAVCERRGGYPGVLAWEAWPCPPEWDCDAAVGECNIPVVLDDASYCGDGTCGGDESCDVCAADCGECATPEPICGDGNCAANESCEDCPSDCGECQTETVLPEEVEQRPQQTVYCERTENGLSVTITGPMLDSIALMQTPENPSLVMLGANGYGWPSSTVVTDWLGDGVAHVLTVPADVSSFNVYVGDDNADGDFWLRLAPNAGARWQAYGACRNGRYEIEVLASGTEELPDDVQTIEPEPEPEPAPESYCGDGGCDAGESCESCASDCGVCAEPEPYCGDGDCSPDETCDDCSIDCGACPEPELPADDAATHVINCELTSSALIVTVTGPLLDRNSLMEIPVEPTRLVVGSDTGGWPTRGIAGSLDSSPQVAWSGDAETHVLNLPVSTDCFNIYLADASDPYRDSWLRLKESDGSPWTVVGDCVMGIGVILQD